MQPARKKSCRKDEPHKYKHITHRSASASWRKEGSWEVRRGDYRERASKQKESARAARERLHCTAASLHAVTDGTATQEQRKYKYAFVHVASELWAATKRNGLPNVPDRSQDELAKKCHKHGGF